jgi:hypothetical protein
MGKCYKKVGKRDPQARNKASTASVVFHYFLPLKNQQENQKNKGELIQDG